ncbi:MAG TPA: hypothetical protein VLM37_07110 [Fibrobacteraceae bacterium]|nr:hypothetical protein [Fibrobacteraceae bacterium]
MRRLLLWLCIVLLALEASSAESLPRLALVDVVGQNLAPSEVRQVEEGLRLGAEQSRLFRVLTTEEEEDRFQKAGEDAPFSCLTERCHRQNAVILGVDLLASAQIFRRADRVHLALTLRSGKTGAVVDHFQVSSLCTQPGDLVALARAAVSQSLGVPYQAPLQYTQDSLVLSPGSRWMGGALLVGAGFALTGFLQGGHFLQSDDNDLDSGFSYNRDGSYSLSGIQGFFFGSRFPSARVRGMGGAGVALTGADGAGLLNPAGLGGLQQSEINLSTAPLPAGAGQQVLASWSAPARQGLWWSHAVRYEGDDLASEFAFSTALAWDCSLLSSWFSGVQGGLRLQALSLQVGEAGDGEARSTGNGIGGAIDVGLQWQIWNGPRLGLHVENLWSNIRYHNTLTGDHYYEDLPISMTFGTSWETPWNTTLALDLRKAVLVDQSDRIMLGLEQKLFDVLFLRGGWYQVMGSDMGLWSLGAGLRIQHSGLALRIAFTYENGPEPYNTLASQQIFSMGLEF